MDLTRLLGLAGVAWTLAACGGGSSSLGVRDAGSTSETSTGDAGSFDGGLDALDGGSSEGDAAAYDDADAGASDANAGSSWSIDDPGPGGFEFVTPPFDVPAGTETERCYFIQVPDLNDGGEAWFDRVAMAMNPGGLELNVLRVKTELNLYGNPGDVVVDGECFRQGNWSDWPVVVNSQQSRADKPVVDWSLPAGAGIAFAPHELLVVQVHYVNDGSRTTPNRGQAGVAFYRSASTNLGRMGVIHATRQNLHVCESGTPAAYAGQCSFATPGATIVAANGLSGPRGQSVDLYAWDVDSGGSPTGAPFYASTAWDAPPMATTLAIPVAAGAGFQWTCSYAWSAPASPHACSDVDAVDRFDGGDCCYDYGLHVGTAERCDAYVYYYPTVTADAGSVSIQCF